MLKLDKNDANCQKWTNVGLSMKMTVSTIQLYYVIFQHNMQSCATLLLSAQLLLSDSVCSLADTVLLLFLSLCISLQCDFGLYDVHALQNQSVR